MTQCMSPEKCAGKYHGTGQLYLAMKASRPVSKQLFVPTTNSTPTPMVNETAVGGVP